MMAPLPQRNFNDTDQSFQQNPDNWLRQGTLALKLLLSKMRCAETGRNRQKVKFLAGHYEIIQPKFGKASMAVSPQETP